MNDEPRTTYHRGTFRPLPELASKPGYQPLLDLELPPSTDLDLVRQAAQTARDNHRLGGIVYEVTM